MSEKIRFNSENKHTPDNHEASEAVSLRHETQKQAPKHEYQDNIDQIMKKVEKISSSNQELNRQGKSDEESNRQKKPNPRFVGKQLKDTTLRRSLRSIRKDLRPDQRSFSRFIHNEAVDQISEFSSKTIARPSGLLFAGIVSFLTSLAVLLICRYYGYEYNYYIGLVSLPVGFAIGIVADIITKPLRSK